MYEEYESEKTTTDGDCKNAQTLSAKKVIPQNAIKIFSLANRMLARAQRRINKAVKSLEKNESSEKLNFPRVIGIGGVQLGLSGVQWGLLCMRRIEEGSV